MHQHRGSCDEAVVVAIIVLASVDVTRVFDLLGGHPGKGSSGHIVDWRGHHSRADRAHLLALLSLAT